MNKLSILTGGIFKQNPIFVLALGLCPTLATTTSAINGLGMGSATMFVLMLSNVFISLIARFVPDKVRIPCYIVLIATFATAVDLSMAAYIPELHKSLGVFIPLITVNCILLGRAEAFAAKNGAFSSLLDGLGMGLGFTLALTILGIVRETLGNNSIFGFKLIEGDGMLIFILAPGAFIVLGYLIVIFNKIRKKANA